MQPAPAHVNQFSAAGVFQSGPMKGRSSSPWDCGVAVGIMALDAATGGTVRPTATEFRARQRDQAKGIGLDDIAEAWRSYPGAPTFGYGPKLWPAAAGRLERGDGVVFVGNAVALGSHRASDYLGPHALYAQRRVVGGILVNDPLRHSPVVIPEGAMRLFYLSGLAQAGWAGSDGRSSGGSWDQGQTVGSNPIADTVTTLVVNGVVLVVVLGLGWSGVKRLVGGTTRAVLVEAPGAALRAGRRAVGG